MVISWSSSCWWWEVCIPRWDLLRWPYGWCVDVTKLTCMAYALNESLLPGCSQTDFGVRLYVWPCLFPVRAACRFHTSTIFFSYKAVTGCWLHRRQGHTAQIHLSIKLALVGEINSIMCTRPFWGTGCRRSPKSLSSAKAASPRSAGIERELESACRVSILILSQYPQSAFQGVLGGRQGVQQQLATQTLRVHLLGTDQSPIADAELFCQKNSFPLETDQRKYQTVSPYRYRFSLDF